MGSRMAGRFLGAGHEVVVWNRTPEKMSELTARGATPAATPADAAGRVEATIVMVADPAALVGVTEGPDGVAAGVRPDGTVIQMSTVGPAAIARLESVLRQGVGLLDAPVLGSRAEVESGSLAIFVGGPPTLVERWSPLLAPLGLVIHVGPIGAGSAAKLVANSTLFGVAGVLGEAFALAAALGLSRETVFDELAATPLAVQAERRRPSLESGEFPARFSLALARKDGDLILEAADQLGARLPLAAAARAWLADAERHGLGERDYSAVVAYIARWR